MKRKAAEDVFSKLSNELLQLNTVREWDSDAVLAWLVTINPVLTKLYSEVFRAGNVHGNKLLTFDKEDLLTDLGIPNKLHRYLSHFQYF